MTREDLQTGSDNSGADLSLREPVLEAQAIDFGKLSFIGADERESKRKSMGGDQQIVTPNRLALLVETGAENTIHPVGGLLKRQNLDSPKHGLGFER